MLRVLIAHLYYFLISYFYTTEVIKKVAAYLNAFMTVIEKIQRAVDSFTSGNVDEYILAWDQAVVMYYGTDGELVYDMAEKRCANFGTCEGDASAANTEIFEAFIEGKEELAAGSCDDVADSAESIVEIMAIPLVHGVIRAAYKLEKKEGGEKQLGFVTVFAAAILTIVNACSSDDASVIHSNLKPDATSTDFAAVNTAFENNYDCMNIDCADVAGLVDDDGEYYEGAEPYGEDDFDDESPAEVTEPTETEAKTPAVEEPAAKEPAAELDAGKDEEVAAMSDSGASVSGVVGSAVIATAALALLL